MPKIRTRNARNPNDYKMCPIIHDRNEYNLSILTMENAHGDYYLGRPVFYVPLRKFMQCGGLWSALELCTVFWEPPIYGIPRDHLENERIKGAYLIEFASDLAPICKAWARGCIEQCRHPSVEAKDEVFVKIVLFNEALKDPMMNAISRHNLKGSICEATNTYTVL
jgi:hypothetical protein